MRIKPQGNFYDRPSNTKQIKPKHFFAFEGVRTEERYFRVVLHKYYENLVFLTRTSAHKGWSHPKKILDLIESTIKNSEAMVLYYKDLEDYLYDFYNLENKLITKNVINKHLRKFLNKFSIKLDDNIDESKLNELLDYINNNLKKEFSLKSILKNNLLINFIKEQSDYRPEIDIISLIVDRDAKSFTKQDYKEVVKKCNEKNIDFYVTNPCFEFWLILHFTKDFTEDERKLLLSNNIQNNKETYAFNLLKSYDNKYNKSNINMNTYLPLLNSAIENANYFANDIDSLIDNLGTNLIDLFIKTSRKK